MLLMRNEEIFQLRFKTLDRIASRRHALFTYKSFEGRRRTASRNFCALFERFWDQTGAKNSPRRKMARVWIRSQEIKLQWQRVFYLRAPLTRCGVASELFFHLAEIIQLIGLINNRQDRLPVSAAVQTLMHRKRGWRTNPSSWRREYGLEHCWDLLNPSRQPQVPAMSMIQSSRLVFLIVKLSQRADDHPALTKFCSSDQVARTIGAGWFGTPATNNNSRLMGALRRFNKWRFIVRRNNII